MTFVNLDGLALFNASLEAYLTNMRQTLSITQAAVDNASLSTRDAAVAGAVKDVEDAFKRMSELLDEIDAVKKVLEFKLVHYTNGMSPYRR